MSFLSLLYENTWVLLELQEPNDFSCSAVLSGCEKVGSHSGVSWFTRGSHQSGKQLLRSCFFILHLRQCSSCEL